MSVSISMEGHLDVSRLEDNKALEICHSLRRKKTKKKGGKNLHVSRLEGNKALEICHSFKEESKTRLYYAPPVQRFVVLREKLEGLVACNQSHSEGMPMMLGLFCL
jgi:hypothetical protein